jgi:hypothetical protein
MNRILILSLVISVMIQNSLQWPHGVPVSRCVTLYPSHGGTASQTTPSPYEIIPKENRVQPGGKLEVEIRATVEGLTFRGFMLQARTPEGVILGQMQQHENIEHNLMDCNGFNTTVANANRNDHSSLTFEWAAPVKYTGTVIFQ